MAKIKCPSCGVDIEIPPEFIAELKAALASGDTDVAALLKELKELVAKKESPALPPPAPAPAPEPERPAEQRRHGMFYDEQ